MVIGCYHKFKQNPILREQLFDTGDAMIVEAAPYDQYININKTNLKTTQYISGML